VAASRADWPTPHVRPARARGRLKLPSRRPRPLLKAYPCPGLAANGTSRASPLGQSIPNGIFMLRVVLGRLGPWHTSRQSLLGTCDGPALAGCTCSAATTRAIIRSCWTQVAGLRACGCPIWKACTSARSAAIEVPT